MRSVKLKHVAVVGILFFLALTILSYVLVYYDFKKAIGYSVFATLILLPVYFYKVIKLIKIERFM